MGYLTCSARLLPRRPKYPPPSTLLCQFYLERFFVFGEFNGDAKFDFIKDISEFWVHDLYPFRAQATTKFAKPGRFYPAQQEGMAKHVKLIKQPMREGLSLGRTLIRIIVHFLKCQ